MTMRILHTGQEQDWLDVLRRARRHDFYHLPKYHALAERCGEGEARLFVYEDEGCLCALPLMLRTLADVAGSRAAAGGWRDATSVYGYAGPLASQENVPESVRRGFQMGLTAALRELRVVSVFSRLHPLIPQRALLEGIGEVRAGGQTVAIDLALPPAVQRAQYGSSVKTRLNRLRRGGVTCQRDAEKKDLPAFVDIYHETMRRVGAQDSYFFEEAYFTGLAECLGPALQLFVITQPGGEPICAALFTLCDGIVQYHLGGTRDAALGLSPMGLAIDEARLWATEQGARFLHLGGGLGSSADSLFLFKAGFSDGRHDFATWRWIIEPNVYRKLEDEAREWHATGGLEAISPLYFPAYRCPTRPRLEPLAPKPSLTAHHG